MRQGTRATVSVKRLDANDVLREHVVTLVMDGADNEPLQWELWGITPDPESDEAEAEIFEEACYEQARRESAEWEADQ